MLDKNVYLCKNCIVSLLRSFGRAVRLSSPRVTARPLFYCGGKMRTCHCTLAGSHACLTCTNYTRDLIGGYNGSNTWPQYTEITEEYDSEGNLIKRVIKR